MKKLFSAIAALALLLLLLPLLTNMEQYLSPSEAPQLFTGERVSLPSGNTFFRHFPARSGRGTPMIMVHGFSGNSWVWDPSYESLASRFELYAYDLYGRGYSERRPSYRYDMALYQTQLAEFIDAMGLAGQPVVLAGMSMGGAISLRYAAEHTTSVAGLVLVDPAGMPFAKPALETAAAALAGVPGVGEWFTAIAFPMVVRQAYKRSFFDDRKADAYFRERYSFSARIEGYRHAILSTVRNMDLNGETASAKTIGAAHIPTLVVWGDKDELVPVANYYTLRELIPQSSGLLLKDIGHMASFEAPELFNQAVLTLWEQNFAGYATAPVSDRTH